MAAQALHDMRNTTLHHMALQVNVMFCIGYMIYAIHDIGGECCAIFGLTLRKNTLLSLSRKQQQGMNVKSIQVMSSKFKKHNLIRVFAYEKSYSRSSVRVNLCSKFSLCQQ